MKSSKKEIGKKKVSWTFLAIIVLVVAHHFLCFYFGLHQFKFLGLVRLFAYGLFGLVTLHIVAFSVAILIALQSSEQINNEPIPNEEKEKKVEGILAQVFQGRMELPKEILKILQILTSVCLGLMVGSGLAWVIELAVT